MSINRSFQGASIKPPGLYGPTKKQEEEMDKANGIVSREVTYIQGWSSGRPMTEERVTLKYKESEQRFALVKYKSMEELIKENPNHFFDCYGNFNTGRIPQEDRPYSYTEQNGVYDHLAPSYFGQMGKTAHRKYMVEEGIQDTWYYTVIDR